MARNRAGFRVGDDVEFVVPPDERRRGVAVAVSAGSVCIRYRMNLQVGMRTIPNVGANERWVENNHVTLIASDWGES